ncbi:TadE/TadG family type IV pilus assembly protein [Vibrio sp. ABG19]|uniref:TadE/TadG family type IV pilus assembly protein n=1 Tax=Vibrio sp. ABG19 TaxID=2817385 RepID=UPI00249F6624|nr:TadE/TadG family type IV pilus assembly protein [Vibrio sp. ABG19]WGY46145.1 pilus assembly protein [Vibrio sp. ABG19]
MKTTRVKNIKGLASIELLIVLPVLLLILAAIAEFGNAFIRYNILSKAVQNGARMAVTEVYGTAKAENIASDEKIKQAVMYGSPKTVVDTQPILEAMTVTVTYSTGDDYVVVTGTYPYQPLVGPWLNDLLSDVTLTASAVMRVTQ